jgi:peptidoglycan/LPS O-acetylase OafA/YrhL
VSDGRNVALDGVRGLAALSVALSHCLLIATGTDVLSKTIVDFPAMTGERIAMRLVALLLPGSAAVMIFFVLSGHVLWASFIRRQMTLPDLPDYLCARVFRLFPIVITSVLLIALFTAPPAMDVLANMLLLSTSMNGVLWSLQTEMVGSIVIFVVWLATRNDPLRLCAALCLAAAAVPFFRGNNLVVYLPAFVLGALVHHVPAPIWQSRVLLAAALFALLVPNIVFAYGGGTRVFEIIGGTIVIGCVGAQRPAILETPIANFLGAVSYPLYLTHLLGVLGAVALVGDLSDKNFLFQLAIYTVVSVGISMPIAWLLHMTVEMPALRARSRLVRRPVSAPPAA